MYIYLFYWADFWDRSVGEVLTHEQCFDEKEIDKMLEHLSEEEKEYSDRITEFLIVNHGFKKPNNLKKYNLNKSKR